MNCRFIIILFASCTLCQIFTFGSNARGQLGHMWGNTSRLLLEEVPFFSNMNISQLYTGWYHSFALSKNGALYGFGRNVDGQLGTNRSNVESRPVIIEFFTQLGVKQVASGLQFSHFLTHDGYVYSTGDNAHGKLGLGDTKSRFIPERIMDLPRISTLFSGIQHTFASAHNGSIYCWGSNVNGQCGIGTQVDIHSPRHNPRLTAIAPRKLTGGDKFTFALGTNGTVYSFGWNFYGQLCQGFASGDDILEPIQVNTTNIVDVAAGYEHTVLLDGFGQVYTCGRNNLGQLGIGQRIPMMSHIMTVSIPTRVKMIGVGVDSVIIHTYNDMFYGFGANYDGQLGIGDKLSRWSPTLLANLNDDIQANDIQLGHYHTMILKDGGVLTCGGNDWGQLGSDSTSSLTKPNDIKCNQAICVDVIAVAVGDFHTITLSNDGEMHSYGANAHGQLGVNNRRDQDTPRLVNLDLLGVGDKISAIRAGSGHNLAFTQHNRVLSWGDNLFGQLGQGDTRDRLIPTPINLMDGSTDGCTSIFKDEGGFSMVIKDGDLFGFGQNNVGQLGLREEHNHLIPTFVNFTSKVMTVSCGSDHSMMIVQFNQSTQRIYVTGSNQDGQLGLEFFGGYVSTPVQLNLTIHGNIKQIVAAYRYSLILIDGKVIVFGLNNYGQLGLGFRHNSVAIPTLMTSLIGHHIVKIRACYFATIALSLQGEVYSCGVNTRGQLGLGDYNPRYLPTRIPDYTNESLNIVDIQIGAFHSTILTNRWCYGKRYDDAHVCAGNGRCMKRNVCSCISGWGNIDCSVPVCNNMTLNIWMNVCNGNGNCVRPNECQCFQVNDNGVRGWKSSNSTNRSQCDQIICDSLLYIGSRCKDPTLFIAFGSFYVIFLMSLLPLLVICCGICIFDLGNFAKEIFANYRIIKKWSGYKGKQKHIEKSLSESLPLLELGGKNNINN